MPTLIEELKYAALCCQPGEERRALIERAVERIETLEGMNRNANGHIAELSDQLAAAKAKLKS